MFSPAIQKNLLRTMVASILLNFLFFAACTEQKTPEEEIKAYVQTAANYMENRETGGLKDLIANNYSDSYNNSKQDVMRILAGYLLRNQNLYVHSSVAEIGLNNDKFRASITVYAAVSKQPASKNDLRLLGSEFYRLKGKLNKKSDWLLESASLQHVSRDEYISNTE